MTRLEAFSQLRELQNTGNGLVLKSLDEMATRLFDDQQRLDWLIDNSIPFDDEAEEIQLIVSDCDEPGKSNKEEAFHKAVREAIDGMMNR